MNQMNKIDLHCHTLASDGTMSPEKVVDLAHSIGLRALAITDHDTVVGIPRAVRQARKLGGIEIIQGIEISNNYSGGMHILGYFLDLEDSRFLSQLQLLQIQRTERNKKIAKQMQNLGIPISMEKLEALKQPGETLGRPHFAQWLVSQGWAVNLLDAFTRYLGPKGSCSASHEKISPKESIQMIKENGGVSVLAHPAFLEVQKKENIRGLLVDLKDQGLDGIEVYHSKHSEEQVQFFLSLAKDLDLCISGGSDFHGENQPNIQLGIGHGNLSVPESILESLRERKKKRITAQNF